MTRVKIFNRDTGECEVVFREGNDYEIFAEHEGWVPTIARWEDRGITLMEIDDEGLLDPETVHLADERFPQALKRYIERQFNGWDVEVTTP